MNASEKYTIIAKTRPADVSPAELRRQGLLPVVIYGGDMSGALNLTVPQAEFAKLYRHAKTSSLVDVQIEGGDTLPALIKEVQFHPSGDQVIHADLRKINLLEKIRTEVPLEFIGEAPAVKTYGAMVVRSKDAIEVEALPKDLPSYIEVDESSLTELDSVITVADLKVPSGVEVLDELEEMVVNVQPPREEEPEEVINEAEAVAGVEATGEKPADGEGETKE